MYSLHNLKSNKAPLIAGVLTDTDFNNINNDLLNSSDLIELRVDMFNNISLNHIEDIFKAVSGNFKKPIIATVRDINEGGQKEIKDRLSIYKAIIPFSDIIDVEISSEDILIETKRLCSEYRKILIGSYHNFKFTPTDDFLDNIVMKGKNLGVDIVKIAAMAKNKEDLIRLMSFTLKHKDKGLITISMGNIGLPSRVFNPFFGSLITYGYISHPSAPGQLSASELKSILKKLKLMAS